MDRLLAYAQDTRYLICSITSTIFKLHCTDARITGGKFKTQTYGVGGGLLVSAGSYRLHAST